MVQLVRALWSEVSAVQKLLRAITSIELHIDEPCKRFSILSGAEGFAQLEAVGRNASPESLAATLGTQGTRASGSSIDGIARCVPHWGTKPCPNRSFFAIVTSSMTQRNRREFSVTPVDARTRLDSLSR